MATVHMLIGIPGSGKTTFWKETLSVKYPDAVVIASDIVRDNNPSLKEEEIWPEIYRLCANALNEKKDVIYDATNITPNVRNRFFEQMKLRNCSDYEKIAYYFSTNPKLCVERVSKRNKMANERYLPLDIIEGYGNRIIMPTLQEGFKEIIIVDNNTNNEKYR